jgi:hypothetical protein
LAPRTCSTNLFTVFPAIGVFNEADTLESSSILIYFAFLTQAFLFLIKLGQLKDRFEESSQNS